jgi:hypothetical protein
VQVPIDGGGYSVETGNPHQLHQLRLDPLEGGPPIVIPTLYSFYLHANCCERFASRAFLLAWQVLSRMGRVEREASSFMTMKEIGHPLLRLGSLGVSLDLNIRALYRYRKFVG